MSRRPVIGVTGPRRRGFPLWAGAWISLRLHGARVRAIAPPFRRSKLDGLDGLVIGGGDDIGAALYGGEVRADVRLDPERDALELECLDHFWSRGAPVLGICRGAQMLNVFRGGSLHRDVKLAYDIERHPRTPLPLKRIRIEPDTRLSLALQLEEVRVNSLHSQSVDRLGRGLFVAARDRHGMVQAIEAHGVAFRVGVQWHPELLFYKRAHRRLFAAFFQAARRAAAGEPARPDIEMALAKPPGFDSAADDEVKMSTQRGLR
jgi:putative glutamine amidotransferase